MCPPIKRRYIDFAYVVFGLFQEDPCTNSLEKGEYFCMGREGTMWLLEKMSNFASMISLQKLPLGAKPCSISFADQNRCEFPNFFCKANVIQYPLKCQIAQQLRCTCALLQPGCFKTQSRNFLERGSNRQRASTRRAGY